MPILNIVHNSHKNYVWANEDGSLTVRVLTSKDYLKEIEIAYGCKHFAFRNESIFYSKLMNKSLTNSYNDLWETNIYLEGRKDYFYYFIVTFKNGEKKLFTPFGLEEIREPNTVNYFQFCHVFENEKTIIPDIAKKKGNVIQIFVDRFNIGNSNNPYLKEKNLNINEPIQPRSYFGGDLDGVTQKINYLKELGITTIYLTPIFKSTSSHRYDVEDYFEIDPRLGGNESLNRLVNEAHKKGISIVLDAVFNHTSYKHPFFLDVVEKGEKSKYFNYYFCDGKPEFEKGNYLTFSRSKGMPKLNTSNREVIDYCKKAIRFITEKFSIDGWRFDVADEMSHLFFEEIRDELRSINPKILLISEDWTDAENYIEGNQFDGKMNYLLRDVICNLLIDKRIDCQTASDRLVDILIRYSWNNNFSMFNLISSHDIPRFMTVANEDKNLTLLALIMTVSFPGMFMSYYGDELGMIGGKDPDNRRPIDWNNLDSNKEYTDCYKKILSLKFIDEFILGKARVYSENGLLFIERFSSENEYIVVMNTKNEKTSYKFNKNIILEHGFDQNNELFSPYGFIVIKK